MLAVRLPRSRSASSKCLRFASALLAVIAALFSGGASEAALKRVALVIANADYAHTARLINPPNDATLIAQKLSALGFAVQLERDVDARRFSEVLAAFAQNLDKDTEALFYYAGHGLQFRGENFLVGIDAHLKIEATLQFETYRLNSVIALLENRASMTLFFWTPAATTPWRMA
jgi:uncharacterized caspase-like protein